MFRLPETFTFPTQPTNPHFGTFVPCLPILHMHPLLSVSRITRWRDARPSGARKQGSQAHVEHLSRAPPYSYSLVSRETREDNPRRQRESPTAPGLALRCAHRLRPRCARPAPPAPVMGRVVPRSGSEGIGTRVFHVKPLSTDQSPLARPGDCRVRLY